MLEPGRTEELLPFDKKLQPTTPATTMLQPWTAKAAAGDNRCYDRFLTRSCNPRRPTTTTLQPWNGELQPTAGGAASNGDGDHGFLLEPSPWQASAVPAAFCWNPHHGKLRRCPWDASTIGDGAATRGHGGGATDHPGVATTMLVDTTTATLHPTTLQRPPRFAGMASTLCCNETRAGL